MISKTFTETATPGEASDSFCLSAGQTMEWTAAGDIDAGVKVLLQRRLEGVAWQTLRTWEEGTIDDSGILVAENGSQVYRFLAVVPSTDPATVLTEFDITMAQAVDVLEEHVNDAGTRVLAVTEEGIETPQAKVTTLKTDTIAEKTSNAGVTIDSVKCKDGSVVLAGGSVQHNNGVAAGSIAEGYGASSAEGLQRVIIEETISFAANAALYKELTATLPANAVVETAQANIQAALTGGGTTVKLGLGTEADPDLYGITSALTKNAKIDHVPAAHAVIGTITALRLSSCASNGAAGDTALTVGSVRVRIVYRVPVSLANAT